MSKGGRQRVTIRARVVVPVSSAPLDNGAIVVHGNKILQVGAWRDLKSLGQEQTLDLGAVALLPGLVNAHCHLELTDFAGTFPPGKPFVDWVRSLLNLKAGWGYEDCRHSWLRGARQLLRHGTTTVANIESTPELLLDHRIASPLRVVSFIEMTGALSGRPPQAILDDALGSLRALSESGRPTGLSPHAPYSTTPQLLQLCAKRAIAGRIRLATHIAESRSEFDMYRHREGPLYEWLKASRDMSDCGGVSPVSHLARCNLLQAKPLAVHANHLAPGDAQTLAQNDVPVVHCPRTHAFFGRAPFPRQELIDQGVNLCLGTDSLASVTPSDPAHPPPALDRFAEMREFRRNFPQVAPETVLDMATRQGARALGLSGKVGELTEDAYADTISIPFTGAKADVLEAILDHKGPVCETIINGKMASPDRQCRNR